MRTFRRVLGKQSARQRGPGFQAVRRETSRAVVEGSAAREKNLKAGERMKVAETRDFGRLHRLDPLSHTHTHTKLTCFLFVGRVVVPLYSGRTEAIARTRLSMPAQMSSSSLLLPGRVPDSRVHLGQCPRALSLFIQISLARFEQLFLFLSIFIVLHCLSVAPFFFYLPAITTMGVSPLRVRLSRSS